MFLCDETKVCIRDINMWTGSQMCKFKLNHLETEKNVRCNDV